MKGISETTRVHVPMPDDLLMEIDEWRRRQLGEIPSRAEAMRRLIKKGLKEE